MPRGAPLEKVEIPDTCHPSRNTAARFDAQGHHVNMRFGEFSNAAEPRRIQFALRLSF